MLKNTLRLWEISQPFEISISSDRFYFYAVIHLTPGLLRLVQRRADTSATPPGVEGVREPGSARPCHRLPQPQRWLGVPPACPLVPSHASTAQGTLDAPAFRPSALQRWPSKGGTSKGPQKWSKGWNPSAGKKGWESWGCSAWRRLQGDLTGTFQYLKRAYKKDEDRLSTRACCDRTRGNGFKLKEGRFRLSIRKTFFTMRVVKPWHRLPREVVDAPSLETFKDRLDRAWSNLLQLKMSLLSAGGMV